MESSAHSTGPTSGLLEWYNLRWPRTSFADRWYAVIAFIILGAALATSYWPCLRGGLIWDDDVHITSPELQSTHGLERIWFEVGATKQYYPVLHTVFWLERRIWGDSLLGYHLATLALHAGVALLAAVLLRRLRVPGCGLLALIFALHPVCVESVAWISEQKNTLSAVFYLAAALVYLRYYDRRDLRTYCTATALFTLALLSKSVTATLPAALLVLGWWRNGHLTWTQDVRPLLPWFVLAVVDGGFTAGVERVYIGAAGRAFQFTLLQRVMIASKDCWFYLSKLLLPTSLSFVYPRWDLHGWTAWSIAQLLLLLLLFGVLWSIRGRVRSPLAVWLYFVGTLFPALGFVNVYPFLFSFVADHFQYLASLGVFALAAAGITLAVALLPGRKRWLGHGAVAALLALLSVLTWQRCHVYRDAQTLYESTLRQNPQCWLCYTNLGVILARKGYLGEAMADYRRSIDLQPGDPDTRFNLGVVLGKLGRHGEAAAEYRRAAALRPGDAAIHANLGVELAANGQEPDAIAEYRRALALQPDYPEGHFMLGNALMAEDLGHEAAAEYRFEIRLAPGDIKARNNLGIALAKLGELENAVRELEAAARLAPGDSECRFNLGLIYSLTDQPAQAVPWYRDALKLKPEDSNSHYHLGLALQAVGQSAEALAEFEAADRFAASAAYGR